MNNKCCYTGIMIRINLTSGKITKEDYSSYFNRWLGGSGLAVKLLYDELPNWATPFEPINKLVISSGALIGTLAPGACKMNISTLGPMTGGWATGSSDSFLGMELKLAGYDGLIIEGRAHSPCYIYVSDDSIELRDASNIWGKNTCESLDILRSELGDSSLHALMIGKAGENMVRGACVIQDKYRAFGRCGTGAVFGSKNLKALVCKGSRQSIGPVHSDRFFKKANECRKRIIESPTADAMGKTGTCSSYRYRQEIGAIAYKNFQGYQLPDEMVDRIDPAKLIDKYSVSRMGFPGCPICCGRMVQVTSGPYKGLKTMMNQYEVVGGIMSKLAVEEATFMIMVNSVCNEYGLDVDMVAGTIGWAMECYQRGIITKDDTDGIELNWGDERLILTLIDKIVNRDGFFGNILAEGCARAADIIGRESEYYAMHIKKQDLYEMMRSSNGVCLGTAVSTRGGTHTTGTPCCEQSSTKINDETSYKLFGIPGKLAQNPDEYDGKPELIRYYEILTRICNSLGICIFNTVWLDMKFVNLEDLAELLSAAVGIEFTISDLDEIAMRQLNMEKAFNLRFTQYDRKDDLPPKRDCNEAIPDGFRKGWKLDMEKYNNMLDKYYEIHGWDKYTSFPSRGTLKKYGLDYVADDLERIGKLMP